VFLEIKSIYSSSSNCNFSNNRADIGSGGAVHVKNSSTYSNSPYCFFENNNAQLGGAVDI
jgi:hypothetical protein